MLVEQMRQAINAHDLDGLVSCFDPDYGSQQPVHPGRTFHGREQVRKNWAHFFEDVPDLQADLLSSALEGDTEWAEWHWYGTRRDGSRFEMRGMTVMGISERLIRWGRLYMEEVEHTEESIDQAVRRLAGPES